MKNSSKMILLSMYGHAELQIFRSYEFLNLTFLNLSPGGIRSMVKKLIDHNYIEKAEISGKVVFRLTSIGRKKVEEDYPIFKQKKRKQAVTTFLIMLSETANSYDAKFHKLKKLFKSFDIQSVMRGVYMYQCVSFSGILYKELIEHYSTQIVVVEIKDFFINIPLKKESINALFAIKNSLSGVSKEISFLLEKINNEKRLMKSFYNRFSSAFHNVELVLKEIGENSIKDSVTIEQSIENFHQWIMISLQLFPITAK